MPCLPSPCLPDDRRARARPAANPATAGPRAPWSQAGRGCGCAASNHAASFARSPRVGQAAPLRPRPRSAAASRAARCEPQARSVVGGPALRRSRLPRRSPRASAARSPATSRRSARPPSRSQCVGQAGMAARGVERLVAALLRMALRAQPRQRLVARSAGGTRAAGSGCGWSPAGASDRRRPATGNVPGCGSSSVFSSALQAASVDRIGGIDDRHLRTAVLRRQRELLRQSRGSARSRSRCAAACPPCSVSNVDEVRRSGCVPAANSWQLRQWPQASRSAARLAHSAARCARRSATARLPSRAGPQINSAWPMRPRVERGAGTCHGSRCCQGANAVMLRWSRPRRQRRDRRRRRRDPRGRDCIDDAETLRLRRGARAIGRAHALEETRRARSRCDRAPGRGRARVRGPARRRRRAAGSGPAAGRRRGVRARRSALHRARGRRPGRHSWNR